MTSHALDSSALLEMTGAPGSRPTTARGSSIYNRAHCAVGSLSSLSSAVGRDWLCRVGVLTESRNGVPRTWRAHVFAVVAKGKGYSIGGYSIHLWCIVQYDRAADIRKHAKRLVLGTGRDLTGFWPNLIFL